MPNPQHPKTEYSLILHRLSLLLLLLLLLLYHTYLRIQETCFIAYVKCCVTLILRREVKSTGKPHTEAILPKDRSTETFLLLSLLLNNVTDCLTRLLQVTLRLKVDLLT